MSKKNRHKNPWGKIAQPPVTPTEPRASARGGLDVSTLTPDTALSPISPAQLAANRANAQLSTGPRTAAGLEKSSKNAVKTALTGRTVLLPSDDVEEYAAFVDGFQHDLKPVGAIECELVQIIADAHWRLRRIQTLEYALYTHGHEQFADAFPNCPQEERYSKILLQTHLTYEKQLRNFHIQEARLDRKRSQALAELLRLQDERRANEESTENLSNAEAPFAPTQAAVPQLPPGVALNANGFEFSTAANRIDDAFPEAA